MREYVECHSEMSIERPGSQYSLLLHYLIISITVSAFTYFLLFSLWKSSSPRNKLIFTAFFTLALMYLVVLALVQTAPIPQVSGRSEIRGQAKQKNRYYYLFVRPISSNSIWLQTPSPIRPGSTNRWIAVAQFGGYSGEKFEIIFISAQTELLGFMDPGEYSYDSLPNTVDKCTRIVSIK